jgi:hypothetical protein
MSANHFKCNRDQRLNMPSKARMISTPDNTADWSSGLKSRLRNQRARGSSPGSEYEFVMNYYTCSRVMAVYILLSI